MSQRSNQSYTEEEKWFAIWKFLFREIKPRPISAYVDLDLPEEVNWLRDYVVSNTPDRLKDIIPDGSHNAVADLLGKIAEEWKTGWREGIAPQASEHLDTSLVPEEELGQTTL